jgi:hypothetical protein
MLSARSSPQGTMAINGFGGREGINGHELLSKGYGHSAVLIIK